MDLLRCKGMIVCRILKKSDICPAHAERGLDADAAVICPEQDGVPQLRQRNRKSGVQRNLSDKCRNLYIF